MSRGLVGESLYNLRHGGPEVVLEVLSRAYYTVGKRTDGLDVFEREWDLLIVLDACRADLMQAVIDEYDWLEYEDTVESAGGTSTEWLETTVAGRELDDVGYVTGNPYSAAYVDDEFAFVDEVWRHGWDDERGLLPARPVTDAAIAAGREREWDRLIVHYMQPHFPCVPRAEADAGIELDRFGEEPISVWEELRFGRRTRDEVWEEYLANLRYVLEEVALLRENVDAERVAVTADHGNAMGEGHLYGHVAGVSLPALRNVPWCTTSASDRETHEPAIGGAAIDESATDGDVGADADANEDEDKTVESRLEALGYR